MCDTSSLGHECEWYRVYPVLVIMVFSMSSYIISTTTNYCLAWTTVRQFFFSFGVVIAKKTKLK